MYRHASVILSDCCRPAVGAGCIIAAGADIGDKTSVKRSVIGPGCVLGSNVKVRAACLHVARYIRDSWIATSTACLTSLGVGRTDFFTVRLVPAAMGHCQALLVCCMSV